MQGRERERDKGEHKLQGQWQNDWIMNHQKTRRRFQGFRMGGNIDFVYLIFGLFFFFFFFFFLFLSRVIVHCGTKHLAGLGKGIQLLLVLSITIPIFCCMLQSSCAKF
ncbi:hypothetical protein QBC46DRAFT_65136 [Diplogelasinospora grovesii]|uniref:Transmembrane protein n=1 Tax=Diplogelasinospora grovesii TaxID=303347 RepID=A0AAN6NLW8_9PEZI|nr:hypothetical protein QBC46DRAFT_65136 [Diplogelasinospora grovesii]